MAKLLMGNVLGVNAIMNLIGGQKFNIQTSYKLAKIRASLKEELDFYKEKFNEILNTYGDKNPDGTYVIKTQKDADGNPIPGTESVQIQEGKIEECNQALEELQKIEIEIDSRGLTIDDLQGIELSLEEMEQIIPLFE